MGEGGIPVNKEIKPIFKRYLPLVRGISETFGSNCEVVLHDFSQKPNSIVAIENSHVTGRAIGSPVTENSLQKVFKSQSGEDVINYSGKTPDGRVLKSTTMFIKDDDGNSVGCLCINYDLTELQMVKTALNNIMKIDESNSEKETEGEPVNRINDVLTDIVLNTIEESGKPVAYLTKEEKVEIVKKLDVQGAFLIKGAIDYVAKVLCVSRYTIYNYLDEIRVSKTNL